MSKTSLTCTVKSFKAKQNFFWWQSTSEIEDPTALRRNSSEITPVFQQKLTAGVTFSDTANNFGIAPSRDASVVRLTTKTMPSNILQWRTTSSLALSNTDVVDPTCSDFLSRRLREPTRPKGFVFIRERAETDHRGRVGSIFPAKPATAH